MVYVADKDVQRWNGMARIWKRSLTGYNVDLQYADDDIPTQVSQIEI